MVYELLLRGERGCVTIFPSVLCDLHRFHADKEELLHLTGLPAALQTAGKATCYSPTYMLHQSARFAHPDWLDNSGFLMAMLSAVVSTERNLAGARSS